VGSGPALVLLPTIPFGYFQLEWEIPEYRTVFENLARHIQLVQYDARGNGLSQRDVPDVSFDAASAWMGWLPAEAARRVARSFRAAVTPEMARAMLDVAMRTDVTGLLHHISAPTRVLHRVAMPLDVEGPREIVAHVEGAQLDILPGDSASPYIGDWTAVVRDVLQFCLDDPSFALPDDPRFPLNPSQTPPAELTRRELEVLRRLAAGDANQQIATSLDLSVHTVERHVANIYRKIDARGRADATAYALRHGLA
jgi:DNA-binding CsgD family transcriptional regulator